MFEDGLKAHPLLDIAFRAFARAEVRLCTRFVPQRSHEERLTGHLVSEIEAALGLVTAAFRESSVSRYGVAQSLDFAYYDLSKGGKLEKTTGADLGLILTIDLPDLPRVVRFVAIQAKKVNSVNATIDAVQYDTLFKHFGHVAYMFYDVDIETLAPPLMVEAEDLFVQREAAKGKTFTIANSSVFAHGMPLSLWLIKILAKNKAGESAADVTTAFSRFLEYERKSFDNEFQSLGRLAVVSIGKPLETSFNGDGQLMIR